MIWKWLILQLARVLMCKWIFNLPNERISHMQHLCRFLYAHQTIIIIRMFCGFINLHPTPNANDFFQ